MRRAGRATVVLGLLLLPAAAALAAIEVEVEGVGAELEDNIRAHLGLVRFAERTDLSPRAVRSLANRAPEQVRQALMPFGYYEPKVSHELTRDGEHWLARITVETGEPVTLKEVDVRVSGEGAELDAFRDLVEESPLAEGRRLRHAEYDGLRTDLQRAAQRYGYFDAEFTTRRLEVNPAERSARALLHLETGPRYRFGSVHVEQGLLAPELMSRMIHIDEGEPYDGDLLLETQYTLTDSAYFDTVLVEPGQPDDEALVVPVRVLTTPSADQRIRLGLGWATDTRLRGSIGWEFRRLNRAGHNASLDLRASEPVTEFTARYRIPLEDPVREHLQLHGKFADEDLGDTESRRFTVGVAHREIMGDWTRTLFVDYTEEETTLPGEPSFEDTLVIPGAALEKLVADDLLYTTDGYRLRGEVRGSVQSLGSTSEFVRYDFVANRVLSPNERWRFFLRSEAGIGVVDEFSELPASQRFFAGGDQSVRGYGYDELGPTDENGNFIGGRNLLFASIEAERQVKGIFSVAAFLDGGGALNDLKDTDALEASAGIGLHIRTPVGTLRFDVARSITEDRSPRLHITIRPDL